MTKEQLPSTIFIAQGNSVPQTAGAHAGVLEAEVFKLPLELRCAEQTFVVW